MRRLLLVPALTIGALGAVTACSEPGTQVVDGEGIAGTYTVNGVDAVGIEYSGTVVITATDDRDRFAVQWIVTGAIQEGLGTLDGDRLDVDWRSVASPRGDSAGSASYVIGPDGDMTGTRTIDGVEGVGTEEIFQDG